LQAPIACEASGSPTLLLQEFPLIIAELLVFRPVLRTATLFLTLL